MDYENFLKLKAQESLDGGFDPIFMPEYLFDFQREIVTWACRKGRAAIFADCGLGKTPMQLVWAENLVRKYNKPVLIVTPLAVGHQTKREGEKFGIECERSNSGRVAKKITITNYERLHLFNPQDYIGVVCDESSILKNFNGKRRAIITEFLRTRPYRLCCTATAAPNDYTELGTTSEAIGELGFMDMLNRFFKNDKNTSDTKRHYAASGGDTVKWRFKRHAEYPFWRWVCSWARALRRPSDIGFNDGGFILPPITEKEIIVKNDAPLPGELFIHPAISLYEQRAERRATTRWRCEKVAEIIQPSVPAICWCHLNEEGDLLEKLIKESVQVSGSDQDDKKEEALLGFATGDIRILITKPRIGGFGMNWQHCSNISVFPSHSFEQYYQSIRRCWRFGQKNAVIVNIISSEGESGVLKNLKRKALAADKMFTNLVATMNESLAIKKENLYTKKEEVPSWL